jgi:hypothetical protein
MSLVPLDPSEEIPMDQVLVWKFPLASAQSKTSLVTEMRRKLASWLMEAAKNIAPKNGNAGDASQDVQR